MARLRVAVLALALLFPGVAPAAKRKARPTPTATPTPVALLRAAGSCVSYEPGKHIVLAEVGTTGRVFRIDESTELATRPKAGARVRILYVDGVDGPVARKILPGPIVATPTPAPQP